MEPIELPLSGLYLAIAKPAEGVSTKEAYSGVKPAVPAVRLYDALAKPVREWQGVVNNDFEPHIFVAHPEIAELKNRMIASGAVYASMSGSGSAVFALFEQQPTLDIEKDKYLILTKL